MIYKIMISFRKFLETVALKGKGSGTLPPPPVDDDDGGDNGDGDDFNNWNWLSKFSCPLRTWYNKFPRESNQVRDLFCNILFDENENKEIKVNAIHPGSRAAYWIPGMTGLFYYKNNSNQSEDFFRRMRKILISSCPRFWSELGIGSEHLDYGLFKPWLEFNMRDLILKDKEENLTHCEKYAQYKIFEEYNSNKEKYNKELKNLIIHLDKIPPQEIENLNIELTPDPQSTKARWDGAYRHRNWEQLDYRIVFRGELAFKW